MVLISIEAVCQDSTKDLVHYVLQADGPIVIWARYATLLVKAADQSALPFSGHELPVAKDRVNRFKDSCSYLRHS